MKVINMFTRTVDAVTFSADVVGSFALVRIAEGMNISSSVWQLDATNKKATLVELVEQGSLRLEDGAGKEWTIYELARVMLDHGIEVIYNEKKNERVRLSDIEDGKIRLNNMDDQDKETGEYAVLSNTGFVVYPQ